MISVIISSYKPEYFSALEKNIGETCGEEFEIIKIENPGKMGICEAYNLGVEKSKFPYLLFLHEDTLFKTNFWGKILVKHLADDETGVVGLAGSDYVPKAPSGWYIEKTKHQYSIRKKAVVLDGMFLAMRKDHFQKIGFSKKLEGFHGYDTDICLRAAKIYQNYMVNDIQIEHFSSGNPDKKWLDNHIKIRKETGNDFQQKINPQLEAQAFENFIAGYFHHYRMNFGNLFKTLAFYPWNIGIRNHISILKKYGIYIRYANSSQSGK